MSHSGQRFGEMSDNVSGQRFEEKTKEGRRTGST